MDQLTTFWATIVIAIVALILSIADLTGWAVVALVVLIAVQVYSVFARPARRRLTRDGSPRVR